MKCWASHVEVLKSGTEGFDLLDEIEGHKKVIDFVLKEIAGG